MRVGTYMCVWFMHAFMSLHKHTDVHTHARTCALLRRHRGRYCVRTAALFSAPDPPPRADCGRGIGDISTPVPISGG